MATVMQHGTHARPRFFVGPRGVLMDRGAGVGPARRLGYRIGAAGASRSDIQVLADLLNRSPDADAALARERDLTRAWEQALVVRLAAVVDRAWTAYTVGIDLARGAA